MKLKPTLALAITLLATSALAGTAGLGKPPGTSTVFQVTPLVSDQSGVAPVTDPDLVNPWGLAHGDGGPLWVSDNGTNKSTVYDRDTGQKQNLVVNIPHGAPTGLAFANSDVDFEVHEGGTSGRAVFLFGTESGAIEGWAPTVDANNAIIAVNDKKFGSVYKGIDLDENRQLLYAADFANNQIQMYDRRFRLIRTFTDPDLPRRFAPFNVMVRATKIYVTFAKRMNHGSDEVDGNGLGYVDVFDADGRLTHLAANGPLNAPWGMTIAPKNFGQFSNMLLVGNFGNGKINAFDPDTGQHLGTLSDSQGNPIVIDGLWGLNSGPGDKVTFSAGPNDEKHGLLGLISVAN